MGRQTALARGGRVDGSEARRHAGGCTPGLPAPTVGRHVGRERPARLLLGRPTSLLRRPPSLRLAVLLRVSAAGGASTTGRRPAPAASHMATPGVRSGAADRADTRARPAPPQAARVPQASFLSPPHPRAAPQPRAWRAPDAAAAGAP